MPDQAAAPSVVLVHVKTGIRRSNDLMLQAHRDFGKCISESREMIAKSRDVMAAADRVLDRRRGG